MFASTPYRVPQTPNIILMEDREDGTLWQLTHRRSDDRFAIRDDEVPRFLLGWVSRFGPSDGPYVRAAGRALRLLVRGGRLGYEVAPMHSSSRVLTRRGLEKTYYLEVTDGNWAVDGDTLGWQVAAGEPSL